MTRLRFVVLSTALWACTACYESHERPETFGLDGGLLDGARPELLPSRCFDSATTLVIGPEPGCVSAVVSGTDAPLGPLTRAEGTPFRVLRLGDRPASVTMVARCDLTDRRFTVWTLSGGDTCEWAESTNVDCGHVEGRGRRLTSAIYPFAAISFDGVSEHRIAGAVPVEIVACVE